MNKSVQIVRNQWDNHISMWVWEFEGKEVVSERRYDSPSRATCLRLLALAERRATDVELERDSYIEFYFVEGVPGNVNTNWEFVKSKLEEIIR